MPPPMAADPRALDECIRAVSTRFPLLSGVTPRNASREHERLVAAWQSGREASPQWERPIIDRALLTQTQRLLHEMVKRIEHEHGWLALYRERLFELLRDLDVVDTAFTSDLPRAADARFGCDGSAGDAVAERFSRAEATSDEETIASDDPDDPRSLLSRMRARVSELRLPVRVLVRERVGSLAAAGDGVVIVAQNRRVPEREIARVVLHEIEGHVLPRERGRGRARGIETLGSAGASEDEEGRALLLEHRAGLLSPHRQRVLAARHRAARLVVSGATFVEVVRATRELVPIAESIAISARVMRGGYARGNDVLGGVARERVYLPAFARVSAAVEREPALLDRLGSCRLSLAAWKMLV
jgi:hypothetical protein